MSFTSMEDKEGQTQCCWLTDHWRDNRLFWQGAYLPFSSGFPGPCLSQQIYSKGVTDYVSECRLNIVSPEQDCQNSSSLAGMNGKVAGLLGKAHLPAFQLTIYCFLLSWVAMRVRPQTIADMQLLAKTRGRECLTKQYVNASTKLLWICGKGHEFWTKPSRIRQDTWCPVCAVAKRRLPQSRSGYPSVTRHEGYVRVKLW